MFRLSSRGTLPCASSLASIPPRSPHPNHSDTPRHPSCLPATILIIASSVVTCAMRRTLVSRKARKKRIAENADMNGANYYDNLNQNRLMADEADDNRFAKAESPPPMSTGSTANGKEMPQFAAYEMKRTDTREDNGNANGGMVGAGRRSTDDRTPLNPTRDPSIRSGNTGPPSYGPMSPQGPPTGAMDGRPSMDSPAMGRRRPSRDQYGNPIPAEAAMDQAAILRLPDLPVEAADTDLRREGTGLLEAATAHHAAGMDLEGWPAASRLAGRSWRIRSASAWNDGQRWHAETRTAARLCRPWIR
ncbi:hypothetical protein KC366_g46 [Hortaea werneckii]|nr:hypothetical protein KC366_g46 [Hortaea werneckii]